VTPPPVFILLRPQLAENIGTAFRALWNCGLKSLRVVNPREPWPHEKALKAAAGAAGELGHVAFFPTLEEATQDLHFLLATTVRQRYIVKPVHVLKEGVSLLRERAAAGLRTGILFGTERTGLEVDEIAPAQGILTIPLNPSYSSLNLAQAVLLVAYEWWQQGVDGPSTDASLATLTRSQELLATAGDLQGFYGQLERALDLSGFLHPPAMRPSMLRNLRALFARIPLTAQEVRTLRGILTSFEHLADSRVSPSQTGEDV